MARVCLPPRLLHGRVIRVQNLNTVEVLLDLDFDVHVARDITLEGVNTAMIPPKLRNAAQHCLIVTLGGKDVLVNVAADSRQRNVLGRVYLADKVADPCGSWMSSPSGLPLHLEVTSFMAHLASHNYDKAEVIRVLSTRRGESL